jgi:hypothetical protein
MEQTQLGDLNFNIDVLNFNIEDYEDVYFEHLLTATYLNAEGKIKILDAVLRSINDVEIERAYITLWKSKLENFLAFKRMWFDNEFTSYFELRIGAKRITKHGDIGLPTDKEYDLLDNDEKFYGYWFDKWWDSEVELFCKWCVLLDLEELFNREELYTRMKRANMDINTGLIYQYFKKVIVWLDKQLENKSIDFEETISKIEVNILPSEFGYLLKKLHEANIITLPYKANDRNNINMARVSKAILAAINIKNKAGNDVTVVKSMSGALNDEKCSLKSKRLIEKAATDLTFLVKK